MLGNCRQNSRQLLSQANRLQRGGKGHDIALFAERFPNPPGELILQDLAQTFESGLVAPRDRVTIMAHDFFTEQPVKGKASNDASQSREYV